MSTDPRIALDALVSALQEHYVAATNKRGDDDPVLDAAYNALAETFEAYEDSLFELTGEVTPLDVDEEDDDDDDSYDDDDDLEDFGEDDDDFYYDDADDDDDH